MSELLHAGRYRGHIRASKVDKSRNGCIQFVARLALVEEIEIDGSVVALDRPAGITAYLMLTTLRGEPNIRQIEALIDALGWNGVSLADLHKNVWSSVELEAVVDDDTNEKGEARVVVSWLNPVGGLRPTPPDVLDELCDQWKRLGDLVRPGS